MKVTTDKSWLGQALKAHNFYRKKHGVKPLALSDDVSAFEIKAILIFSITNYYSITNYNSFAKLLNLGQTSVHRMRRCNTVRMVMEKTFIGAVEQCLMEKAP